MLTVQSCFAQQKNTPADKSHNENLKELSTSIFTYPEFTNGTIFLKDGSAVNKKLNYNRIIGKLFYLDRQGQSRIFDDTNNIKKVIIASDTFFLYTNNFLKMLTHAANVNLYVSQRIDYIINDKSANSSIIVVTDISKLNSRSTESKKDELDKNSSFKLINTYFIGDTTGTVYPASKRNFYELFPANENELKKYFRSHAVSFEDSNDLQNLFTYIQSL